MPIFPHRTLIWITLIAGLCTPLAAQLPAIPITAKQAIKEMEAMDALHPEAKAFQSAAERAYPVAWVDGRPTVGFIGQLDDLLTKEDWLAWAEAEPAIAPGTCRNGIASLQIIASHLYRFGQTILQFVSPQTTLPIKRLLPCPPSLSLRQLE